MAEHSSFGHCELIPEEKQVEIGLKIKEIMTEVERAKNPSIRELLRLEASRVLERAKFAYNEDDMARAA
jgi:hypothetical protein